MRALSTQEKDIDLLVVKVESLVGLGSANKSHLHETLTESEVFEEEGLTPNLEDVQPRKSKVIVTKDDATTPLKKKGDEHQMEKHIQERSILASMNEHIAKISDGTAMPRACGTGEAE
ncbi:60 kDa heat shock protein, mitochondrial-like [Trachypithecus francoisi]|uniref:60 kDa heat shock protein, mitochondrial-like n=1 Tax=Trachypithecus francoisi TaxID=54180 RepID=UPI00141B2084|nr:60 kDa heat shock protein, mitochondrial-like [Trachypithecus francoisi]